jgi:pilus assembly protein CpaE
MTDLTFDLTEDPHRTERARTERVSHESGDPHGGVSGVFPETVQARDNARVPHITIHAFCESPDVAAAISRAAADRLMGRAQVGVHMGGVATAIETYQQMPTPNLVVLESRSASALFLAELDRLAEVCYAGTKVMAIGHTNDIGFYRELMKRGISEYMLAPLDPPALIAAISGIYGEATSRKLGQIYAFVGAKGGVGSSTIAHNVSWTAARRFSSSVILADMDLPFGTAGLDFNLDAGLGVADAIQDAGRLDEVLLERLLVKCGEHLSLLSAPATLEKSYDLQEKAVLALLEVAQASVPFLVLDLPHQWTAWAKNVLISADEIVIAAEPDLANLRNAKNMIQILRQTRPNDPPPKLVLNRVGMPKRPEIKPNEFAKAVQLEPIACIPFEANLFGTAANKGQMVAEISTRSAATKCFGDIADLITGHSERRRNRKGALDLGSLLQRIRRNSQGTAKRAS